MKNGAIFRFLQHSFVLALLLKQSFNVLQAVSAIVRTILWEITTHYTSAKGGNSPKAFFIHDSKPDICFSALASPTKTKSCLILWAILLFVLVGMFCFVLFNSDFKFYKSLPRNVNTICRKCAICYFFYVAMCCSILRHDPQVFPSSLLSPSKESAIDLFFTAAILVWNHRYRVINKINEASVPLSCTLALLDLNGTKPSLVS